ncbi:sarcosine oxidase subunit gamma [uncultured Tateyamaria sp.]|uniref:sarcosine oxidase subunit gamma n=1 Tax=uncultured Tateyamaria sp. TaxID=455651 RepID=UPI00262E5DB4|nr:sarcosine oxidase subunit gamma [uncultured Tateyamaria sp.]
MHDLTPITALGGTAPHIDTAGDVTLTEVPDVSLASVAARVGQENVCATRLAKLLGAMAPEPGRASSGDPYAALWTGPNQWMLSADFNTHEDIAAEVKSHLTDAASVTEQTDAWVCFDLTGPRINAVLELLCNIDLTRFDTTHATRTSIHHLGCFVISTEAGQSVRILGPRASAGSLHHAITTAMASAL